MNNNLHELAFILDQSSSIKDMLDSAEKSFKNLLKKQGKFPGKTNITTSVFGSRYELLFDNLPVSKTDFSKKLFSPSGVCPLIDSAVKTIDDMGVRLAKTNEDDRPSQIIVSIVTFNRDNASKLHTYEELADQIRIQRDVYKWKFFLVTDFSINMEKLGISEDDTILMKLREPDSFEKAYDELGRKITEVRENPINRF